MLVNFTDLQNLQDANAEAFNSRYGAILDALNGNLDSTNLANGAVTLPKLATGVMSTANLVNPYKFSVYANSSPGLTANVWGKVPLGAELFDTSGNFDSTTNYRFTAPVAGFYQFNAQVSIGSAGMSSVVGALAALYKNGSAAHITAQLSGSGNATVLPRFNISVMLQLAASDYIELFAFCNEARDITQGADRTYMQGFLVSTT